MSVKLREFAEEIGERLIRLGYKAYVVGGYLRDTHLGREPSDIDLATNAKPDEIEHIFSDCLIYDAGKNFGTVGVYSIKVDIAIEITTFRKDLQCDGRKAIVEFSDTIDEDLKRRDFTINSMAMDLETNKLVDPFNGRYDLDRKIVRAVGDANERFQEDYLRMLRACRFMALDDSMEMAQETLEAIRRNARKIQRISVERLRMELLKAMKYPVPSNMIHTMRTTGLLRLVLPELQQAVGVAQNRYHCLYICKECGEYHTIKGNPADGDNVKVFPWQADITALDKDSMHTLLLRQSIVKYKEVWRELAKG